jgi:hypothetical protein
LNAKFGEKARLQLVLDMMLPFYPHPTSGAQHSSPCSDQKIIKQMRDYQIYLARDAKSSNCYTDCPHYGAIKWSIQESTALCPPDTTIATANNQQIR